MSGEVRLSKHAPSVWVESQIGNHIAIPAAEFEKWRRVVDAAKAWYMAVPGGGLSWNFELCVAVSALPCDYPLGPAGAKEGE